MKSVYRILGVLLLVAAVAGVAIWTGVYDVAADEPHWALTRSVMESVREHSIARRSAGVAAPALDDEALIRGSAGNYDVMCADCHLKPGVAASEMSRGLYPAPPNLASGPAPDPAAAYWAIKHGIKMTGMPAWGKSMGDEYVWGLVAFVRKLPELTPEQYHELVEASGGHHHGGAEGGMEHEESGAGHVHADETAGDSHDDDDDSHPLPHEH